MYKILLSILVLFALCNLCICQSSPSVSVNDGKINLNSLKDGFCNTSGHTAYCCAHVDIKEIGLDGTLCMNATYLPTILGFDFEVIYNGKIIYNVQRNLQNLDFCFDWLGASFCFDFENMTYSTTQVAGCIHLVISAFHRKLLSMSLGCFTITI